VPTPSTFATIFFLLIVITVAGSLVWASRKASAGRNWWAIPAIVFVGWLVMPGVLARAGALDRYSPLPAPALVMMAVLTVGTVVLAFSPFGARLAETVPLQGLVGFQVFRLGVEYVLHRLCDDGVVPVQMTFMGRNFDFVTGLTALALAMWLRSGRGGRGLVLAWNLLGLGLLANIIVIAVLSTPVPFRHFMNEPANLLPSTFPYVWLPSFLVQAALFGHLLVFRALGRKDLK
jgi:hypothetical protein